MQAPLANKGQRYADFAKTLPYEISQNCRVKRL